MTNNDNGYNFLIEKTEIEQILDKAIVKMRLEVNQAFTDIINKLLKENEELKRINGELNKTRLIKRVVRKRHGKNS